MLINHTLETIFDEYAYKYEIHIYKQYPHLLNVNIHCLYYEQYLLLKNVPKVEFTDNDIFAFSCCHNENNNFIEGFIIYSKFNCNSFNLNKDEFNAALSHEIGHIIHYFNETLNDKPDIVLEIKADEVVVHLGLGMPLSNLLHKLIDSNRYTDYQVQSMKKRIMLL